MTEALILAVDVGGTKTACSLYRMSTPEKRETLLEKRFDSYRYAGLIQLVKDFLKSSPHKPDAAGIGVAGPVVDQTVSVTNLPWPEVSAQQIEQECSIPRVLFMNDMEAQAFGTLTLADGEVDWLQPGQKRFGNRAVIAAGTGLGEALICMKQDRSPLVSASEGGHTDFSPQCDEDVRLMTFLWKEFKHISWERVVSGRLGIKNIYRFLKSEGQFSGADLVEKLITDPDDYSPAVTAAAEQGSQIAIHTLKTFTRLYGAEAGNLALKSLALGGIYVIGGLGQRLMPYLRDGGFLEAFHNKGRFASFMKDLPVGIVRPVDLGIRGAAYAAMCLPNDANYGT